MSGHAFNGVHGCNELDCDYNSVHESHRVAIETRFLGATDYRGSRIVARTADVSGPAGLSRIVVDYDHALDGPDNHHAAAAALLNRYKSHGMLPETARLIAGATRTGYVYVIVGGLA